MKPDDTTPLLTPASLAATTVSRYREPGTSPVTCVENGTALRYSFTVQLYGTALRYSFVVLEEVRAVEHYYLPESASVFPLFIINNLQEKQAPNNSRRNTATK